jgi:hypothetical protein
MNLSGQSPASLTALLTETRKGQQMTQQQFSSLMTLLRRIDKNTEEELVRRAAKKGREVEP